MLADIIRIIMNYDSETAGLLVGCKTINEAINNILVSLAEPKSPHQYSQRAKEEKIGKFTDKWSEKNNIYQSDRFKPKKVEDSWKNSSDPKKIANTHISIVESSKRDGINYLNNVHITKLPKYLNTQEDFP